MIGKLMGQSIMQQKVLYFAILLLLGIVAVVVVIAVSLNNHITTHTKWLTDVYVVDIKAVKDLIKPPPPSAKFTQPDNYMKEYHMFQQMNMKEQEAYLNYSKDEKIKKYYPHR